jgi:hypothetical protein
MLYFTADRVRPLVFLVGVNASRRFKFNKRRQLFISTHYEAFSVAAMRVSNPDRSPVRIHS